MSSHITSRPRSWTRTTTRSATCGVAEWFCTSYYADTRPLRVNLRKTSWRKWKAGNTTTTVTLLIWFQLFFLIFSFFTKQAEEWSKVSQEAKNLIDRMLTYDPEKRISAQECLTDPWIQKNSANLPLNSKVLLNLGNFNVFNKFNKIKLWYIYGLKKLRPKLSSRLPCTHLSRLKSWAKLRKAIWRKPSRL